MTRELLVKGAASAVIAYDPKEDAVVLVEQYVLVHINLNQLVPLGY